MKNKAGEYFQEINTFTDINDFESDTLAPEKVITKKGVRLSNDSRTPRSTAATYSPNWCVSTIGARGLNCSVRYGKRWDPAAKATANIT